MSFATCPTINVVDKRAPGGYRVINLSDMTDKETEYTGKSYTEQQEAKTAKAAKAPKKAK